MTDISKQYFDFVKKEGERIPLVIYSEHRVIKVKINGNSQYLDNELVYSEKELAEFYYGFNPQYLFEAMKVFKDENYVRFSFNLSKKKGCIKSPLIITDSKKDTLILILPVNIDF